jgi:thioredoxin
VIRLLLFAAVAGLLFYLYRILRVGRVTPGAVAVTPALESSAKTVGTIANFDETVIQGSHAAPTLVDFWAPWCGPCQSLSPILDATIQHYGGRVRLVTVNIDQQSELAERFRIQGIPAVKIFRDGAVIDEFVGLQSERQIQWMLDQHLPPKEVSAD